MAIERQVDADRVAVLLRQIADPFLEGDLPAVEGALVAGLQVDGGRDVDVAGLAFEEQRRLHEIRAPAPEAYGARIARRRGGILAERRRDEQAVPVEPGRAALGLGQGKAIADETLLDEVELPQHDGIGAAARQAHEPIALLGLKRAAALPDPILTLGLSQRIDIEHRFPGRLRLAVLVHRGAAPQAAHMGGILPEIVELAAPPRDEGNVVGPGRDFVQRLLVGLEGGIAQGGPGQLVMGSHPAERLLLLDILEPEIGIGLLGHPFGHGIGPFSFVIAVRRESVTGIIGHAGPTATLDLEPNGSPSVEREPP